MIHRRAALLSLLSAGAAAAEQKVNQDGTTSWTMPKYKGHVNGALLSQELVKSASMAVAYGDANLAVLLKAIAACLITEHVRMDIIPIDGDDEVSVLAAISIPIKAAKNGQ